MGVQDSARIPGFARAGVAFSSESESGSTFVAVASTYIFRFSFKKLDADSNSDPDPDFQERISRISAPRIRSFCGLFAAYREGTTPELLFPNARFLVSRLAWERARHPHLRDHASFIPELLELMFQSDQLELAEGAHSPTLGEAVRFEYSGGHPPGQLLAEIGGNGGISFCSDLIPGKAWMHPPVTKGYDRYPELVINEKHQYLDNKIARGVSLFFTHDPACALARPMRDADGKYGVTDEQAVMKDLILP